MIEVTHIKCGKTAFLLKYPVPYGGYLFAENVILLNGKKCEPGQALFCGSCGERLKSINCDVLRIETWRSWLIPDEEKRRMYNL